MYCPRCGQQQISDETKFCSRCGLQLGLVGELVEHDGVLPRLEQLAKSNAGLFTRKNGVILSVLWFIFFVMMVPAFFGIADFDEGAAASAVFGVFTSMMLLIVSLAMFPSSKAARKRPKNEIPASNFPPGLYGTPAVGTLPPQQTQPASSYVPPPGTWRSDSAELARPGTVTEDTTRLLKTDEEK
jgi:hypothetical protein